jgi:ATP-dependent DNA ligase
LGPRSPSVFLVFEDAGNCRFDGYPARVPRDSTYRNRRPICGSPPVSIEPCLPSPAVRPPSGANWIHEIKHDGFRLMARRDPVAIGTRHPQRQ